MDPQLLNTTLLLSITQRTELLLSDLLDARAHLVPTADTLLKIADAVARLAAVRKTLAQLNLIDPTNPPARPSEPTSEPTSEPVGRVCDPTSPAPADAPPSIDSSHVSGDHPLDSSPDSAEVRSCLQSAIDLVAELSNSSDPSDPPTPPIRPIEAIQPLQPILPTVTAHPTAPTATDPSDPTEHSPARTAPSANNPSTPQSESHNPQPLPSLRALAIPSVPLDRLPAHTQKTQANVQKIADLPVPPPTPRPSGPPSLPPNQTPKLIPIPIGAIGRNPTPDEILKFLRSKLGREATPLLIPLNDTPPP